jgi:AcrR family transcriptional regulator
MSNLAGAHPAGMLRGGRAAGGRLLTSRGLRTRAGLVAAAKQVFETTPFAEGRILDITMKAGMATGTFYTYFDSKDQIFREVANEVLAEMAAAPTRDPDNPDGDPIRNIAHASRAYFQACLRNAGIARSIEHVAPSDEAVAEARHNTLTRGVKRTDRWIRRLQDQGICDTEIDSWNTARVLNMMTVRVAYDLLLSGDERDLEDLVDTVTHVWARTVGLEAVEPAAPRARARAPASAHNAT